MARAQPCWRPGATRLLTPVDAQGRFFRATASISRASPRKQAATQRNRPTSLVSRIGESLCMAPVRRRILVCVFAIHVRPRGFCAPILLEHLFYVKSILAHSGAPTAFLQNQRHAL